MDKPKRTNRNTKATAFVGVYISVELNEALENYAREQERSKSQVCAIALRTFLNDQGKPQQAF